MKNPLYLAYIFLFVLLHDALAQPTPELVADWRTRCPVVIPVDEVAVRGVKVSNIHNVPSLYPKKLWLAEIEGDVESIVTVDMEGAVVDVREVRSTHPAFFRFAAKAIRQWRYSKPTMNGEAVCVEIRVMSQFKLR